jgi:hypothetical protein
LFSLPGSLCLTLSAPDDVIGELQTLLHKKSAGLSRSKLRLLEEVDKESAALFKAIQKAQALGDSFGDMLPGSVEESRHTVPVAKSAGEAEWESATPQASLFLLVPPHVHASVALHVAYDRNLYSLP